MEDLRKAKYILWLDNGYEGWSPIPMETLKEAIEYDTLASMKLITKGPVDYEIIEKEDI